MSTDRYDGTPRTGKTSRHVTRATRRWPIDEVLTQGTVDGGTTPIKAIAKPECDAETRPALAPNLTDEKRYRRRVNAMIPNDQVERRAALTLAK